MRSGPVKAVVLATALLGVGAIYVATGSAAAPSTPDPAPTSPRDARYAESVKPTPAAISHYAILRRAPSESDSYEATISAIAGRATAADVQSSEGERLSKASDSDWKIWVGPSGEGVCVSFLERHTTPQVAEVEKPAGACGAGTALTDGALLTLSDGPGLKGTETQLVGAAPDGVEQVSVGLADGSTRTLPVVDNTYHGQFPVGTLNVEFDAPDGHHTIHAPSASSASSSPIGDKG